MQDALLNGHLDWKTSAGFKKEHVFVPVLSIYVTVDFCGGKGKPFLQLQIKPDEHVRNSR